MIFKSLGKTFAQSFSWIFSLQIETHSDCCKCYGMYVMYLGVLKKCKRITGMVVNITKLSRRKKNVNDNLPTNTYLPVNDSANLQASFALLIVLCSHSLVLLKIGLTHHDASFAFFFASF